MKKALIACILLLVFCLLLASCKKECEHVYDGDCDEVCNRCGEERIATHDWIDADCTTPKTCSLCAATEGNALGHTPEEDDGNCQTEQKCVFCGAIAVESKDAHVDNNNDGVCDNGDCRITLNGESKDEDDGIDLPIDRN